MKRTSNLPLHLHSKNYDCMSFARSTNKKSWISSTKKISRLLSGETDIDEHIVIKKRKVMMMFIIITIFIIITTPHFGPRLHLLLFSSQECNDRECLVKGSVAIIKDLQCHTLMNQIHTIDSFYLKVNQACGFEI